MRIPMSGVRLGIAFHISSMEALKIPIPVIRILRRCSGLYAMIEAITLRMGIALKA
jgi:hypothetical protein